MPSIRPIFTRSTILQILGFIGLLAITWVDIEILLPHLSPGYSQSSINLMSSALESVWIGLLSWYVLFIQSRSLKRIKILEGMLSICSFCKRIRTKGNWVPVEVYVQEHSEADFSHGLCHECGMKHYGDLYLRSQQVEPSNGKKSPPHSI
jgi:hypothetical protein